MRFLVILFLVFTIPFNAAFAAGAGVCDALEGKVPHGEHVGHHAHEHDNSIGHNVIGKGNPTDPAQSGGDHNHSHAHPPLSWMQAVGIDLPIPMVVSKANTLPAQSFISAIPPGFERPPRFVTVA